MFGGKWLLYIGIQLLWLSYGKHLPSKCIMQLLLYAVYDSSKWLYCMLRANHGSHWSSDELHKMQAYA